MKRSATVLIVPVLSLLLAGAFAPQSSVPAPTPDGPRIATGWVFYLVNTLTGSPWAEMTEPRRSDAAKPAESSPAFESILMD